MEMSLYSSLGRKMAILVRLMCMNQRIKVWWRLESSSEFCIYLMTNAICWFDRPLCPQASFCLRTWQHNISQFSKSKTHFRWALWIFNWRQWDWLFISSKKIKASHSFQHIHCLYMYIIHIHEMCFYEINNFEFVFEFSGPLRGESTGDRWYPFTKGRVSMSCRYLWPSLLQWCASQLCLQSLDWLID